MLINNRFAYDPVADLLGTGGFGKVYKAHDGMLQRTVVLKMVQKSKIHDRYDLVSEIRRIINYRHTNLVEFYDVFANPITDASGAPDELQVGVMEYINGGSLKELIGQKLNIHTVEELLKGVLRGLAYLHQNGIIHRDIKPANILIQKTQSGELIAKITDFNISKLIHSEGSSISSVIGTYEYMSPEQLGKGDGKIGIPADIWSFGAMVYEIFTGEGPFGSRRNGDTDSVIITNIISKLNFDKIESIPIPYRDIVLKCLQKNPSDRFTDCNEILSRLDDATKVIQEREGYEIPQRKAGNETDDKTILVDKGESPTKIPEVEPENPKGPILGSERTNIFGEALVWLAKYWWGTLILIILLIWGIVLLLSANSSENRASNLGSTKSSILNEPGIYAEIVTSKGNIVASLFYQNAPIAVANFIGLANGKILNSARSKGTPYYDGQSFKTTEYLIMTDSFDQNALLVGTEYSLAREFAYHSFKEPGMLATFCPDSKYHGSSFLISKKNMDGRSGQDAIFGKVINGLEVD